jgi:hypothetical protein
MRVPPHGIFGGGAQESHRARKISSGSEMRREFTGNFTRPFAIRRRFLFPDTSV